MKKIKAKTEIGASRQQRPTTITNSNLAEVATAERKADEYRLIPRKDIFPDPDQPRKTFDATGLEELAESIRQQGIVQPLIVRLVPALMFAQALGRARQVVNDLAELERRAAAGESRPAANDETRMTN